MSKVIRIFNVIPKFLNRRTVEKEVFNVVYYIITIWAHLIISHFHLAK